MALSFRESLFLLAIATPIAYVVLRPDPDAVAVGSLAKQFVVSPDGKWAAALRPDNIDINSTQPVPVDRLFIESTTSRKALAKPVFTAVFKPDQTFQLKWESATMLVVSYPIDAKFYQQENQVGNVNVRYATRPQKQ